MFIGLIEQDMYDISLNESVYEERTRGAIHDAHTFNHFCGSRGNTRYMHMKQYLQNGSRYRAKV